MAKGLRQRCFGTGCVKSIQKIYWNSIQIDVVHTSIHMSRTGTLMQFDAIRRVKIIISYVCVSGRDPPGKGQTLASSAYNYDHYDESWPQGCAGMSGTLGANVRESDVFSRHSKICVYDFDFLKLLQLGDWFVPCDHNKLAF